MNPQIKKAGKFVLAFVLAPIILPILYFYFTNLDDVSLWLWAWMFCFAWVVFSKKPFEKKGFIFLVSSVALGTWGLNFFSDDKYQVYHLSVQMISQIMIVTGSGLGANLLAHWMIESEKKKANRK